MVTRKLPSDMEEEILFRLPPRSLVRSRSVCKGWNNLFRSKRFINRNFCDHPEFMLKTHSHLYSISVDLNKDPTIKVTDLCFDVPRGGRFYILGICDGYFFIDNFDKGCLVWNPFLGHAAKTIPKDEEACGKSIGYDCSRQERSFKIIGCMSTNGIYRVLTFKFATNAWKVTHRNTFGEWLSSSDCSKVSLNGNLYWTGYKYLENGQYFIQMLDFSEAIIKIFCVLPSNGKIKSFHNRVLSLYKGDRFSVLQQCTKTSEITIWVTEDKIGNGDDGDNVVWIKFMTIPRPDFPMVLS